MADTLQAPFDLFITCVDKFGPMLTIWGQTDRNNSTFIEQLLRNQSLQFESAPVVPRLSDLSVNLLCCAKYRDGYYYRARITNLRNLVSGSVEVLFIDYGNAELIAIENIRLMNNVPAGLIELKPQATNFVLANMMTVNRNWDERALTFIHQEIAYMELKSTVVRRVNDRRFVKIIFHETDLAEYLVEKGIAAQVALDAQEAWIRNYDASTSVVRGPFQRPVGLVMSPQHNYMNNAAQQMHPAMMQQQIQQLQQQQQQQQQQLASYKTLPLPPDSEHLVYVSYVEDGPYLFSIQLQSQEDVLERLMNEINAIPLLPLVEPPVPGYPCMARCLEDGSLCRAVVINMVEEKCKTYYVDFGNTDILPFTNIFQIPLKYILPKVMSMRFTLAGLKKCNVTNEMKCAFKEFVTNKLLRLKVFKLDSSPVMQYCELYDGDMNIINILYESSNDYKTIQISKGQKYNVIVSFITGCKKFFVQLKDYSETLNNLMMTLVTTCETTANLQEYAAVGTPCVAFYSGDNQWYRAQIISVDSNAVTVRYVDYGNEDTVAPHYLKTIDPAFVKILPAQAIECCLYGYQNMSFNDEIESVFESLTLECEFTMKVISKQSNDTLLVDLFDATGNNVAALLIEKLAAQKSQISPLPSHQITRSLFNNKDEVCPSPRSEKSYPEDKSPARSPEKPAWRNPSNDKSWKNAGEEKKSWRNTNNNEKNSWRNTENSPPPKDNGSWNGDSPTNKRFNQRNERHDQRNQPKSDTGKSNRFPDNKRSPRSEYGKANSSLNSGSESEKSFGSRSGKKFNGKRDFKQNKSNDFTKPNEASVKRKVELPAQNLAPFEEHYTQMNIVPSTTEQVAISWFYNPENFYCQLVTNQKAFREMMCEIQSAYNGRSGIISAVHVGSSVIAEFPEDSILYRATVLENKHPKYKVQYIDFGNISLVDITKLWQVEQRFMNIPVQAVKCTVAGVKSAGETWPGTEAIDKIFNKDSFTATFETLTDDQYAIQLYDNDSSIKQLLLDSGVALDVTAALQMTDEPIDLNVLIGQNIYCHISFVHGLSRFFVYLEKNKAMQVQESINSFMQTASVSQFTSEELQVGAACLTKVTEDLWYRGVVRSTDNLQALQLDYPDIGDRGERTIDEIYVLPQELCNYWYQAFECSVHNLSDTVTRLVTDEDFTTNYEGKDVLLYIDEIIENRILVTLYEPVTGTKINLIEPDVDAYPTVEPLCALPILTSTMLVWVSHINNASSMYLQRNSDIELIAVFLEKLFEFYEPSEAQTDLAIGDLCCAKSELDGNWYRGRVESKTDDTCTVLYIDYGNSETVPVNSLRPLDPQFYTTHELALNVGLNLKEISADLTAKLTELTTDKPELKAVIYYADAGWLVDLFDGETSINQTLIDLNLAAALDEDVPEAVEAQAADVKVEQPAAVAETHDDEIRTSISITHVDSPGEFYVQLLANEKSIGDLQADLQERVAALPELEGADVGVLCAAKYSVDEQWYRAEVLDADADITTVRFVDFGNTDVINNNDGSVKTLPADLLAIDKYASKCSLNIKPAKGEEWPQEAVEMFESAVYNARTLHADIVYQDEKSKTFVELYIDGNNVAEQLLTANAALAIVRDAEESIASNTGFVSHLNSIAEFWIQLESSVPDLEMIVDRLASADTFPDLQDLSPGILCAANFPDDEMWYRARILSNTVAGIEVLFVDYGNSSTAMKLKVLPEDLVQMQILAQKCSLQKPSDIGVWSEPAIEKFREISADGVTIFTVKKLAAGETSIVELFMDGENVVDRLAALCDVSSDVERVTPVAEPTYEKVHITHVESPAYFWVQQAAVMEKIDDIMESLSAADTYERLTDWDSDTTCAALYADSGLWYRAKILEFADQYEVLLIDFGNTLCTGEVRVLPADLASAAPLATLCSLEYPPDVTDWSDAACVKFADATANRYTDCRAEFLDGEFPSTVRLFIDGKNVAQEICSDGPLAPKQPSASSALRSETVALAESTPLPDADANDEEELLHAETDTKAAETTVYEECDTTLKDENAGNASFVSCADDTAANLDVDDSSETVEAAHKMEDTIDATLDVELSTNTDTDTSAKTVAAVLTNLDDSNISEMPVICTATSVEELADNVEGPDVENTDKDTEVASASTELEVSVSEATDDIEEDGSIEAEIENITKQVHDEEEPPEMMRSRSITPHSERIVPGSVCRGDLEQVPLGQSRPATPHHEKIVPGAVSRGDLEQAPLVPSRPATPHQDKIVPGAVSRGDLEEVALVEVPNRPATPHQDKIVPGAVSRGDVSSGEMPTSPTEEEQQIQDADGPHSRPVTPHCDKIVPGAISRGDLATPEKAIIIKRSATPPIEKIVPGSISRGDLDMPLQTENQNDIIP